MGRFYKATPSQFIDDKMFQLPFAEVAATINQVDKNIDEAYDEGQSIQDALDSQKLDSDDPAVTERYAYFDNIAEQSAIEMDKSPLSYKKHLGKLRRTSRELSTDLKTGLIGRAEEQFEDFNAIQAEVKGRKDVKQETKDIYGDYLLKQYGSLDYDPKTKSFNKIKDQELNLKGGIIDENKFISDIGTSFEFHSKGQGGVGAGSMKGIDGKVIFTTTTTESTRSPERVKAVMESELAARDYRGEREQFYMMKQTIGEDSPEDFNDEGELMTPEELAKRDEDALIERGVNKLTGKKGHKNTSVKSLSSVTGKTDETNKFNDEVVDNSGSDEVREKTTETNNSIASLIKEGQLKGYSSPQDLIQSVTSPTGDGRTFNTGFASLNEQGMFINDKIGYTNWVNANHEASVLKKVVPQSLLNTYNTSEQSQDVTIYYRDKDNKRQLLPFRSSADLVAHNQDAGHEFIWIKKTGSSKSETPTYSRNEKGYLIDKNGIVITKSVGEGENAVDMPIKDPNEVSQFNPLKPVLNYEEIPSYNTSGNVLTAKAGELKMSTTTVLNTLGQVSEKKELVHTEQWFAIDRNTNKFTLHSIDIISDPKRFPENTD